MGGIGKMNGGFRAITAAIIAVFLIFSCLLSATAALADSSDQDQAAPARVVNVAGETWGDDIRLKIRFEGVLDYSFFTLSDPP